MPERPMIEPPLPHLTGAKAYERTKKANPKIVLLLSILVLAHGLFISWLAFHGPALSRRFNAAVGCAFIAAGIYGVVAAASIRRGNAG